MTAGVVCVDANFIVGLVSSAPSETRFRNLWSQWRESVHRIVAPALIYYEISNAFHRLTVGGLLLPERASQFLEDALSLNITLYSDAELHQHALTLAKQLMLPATYDAHYLTLAQRLGAEFWTADRRLVQSVQATLPWVNLAV